MPDWRTRAAAGGSLRLPGSPRTRPLGEREAMSRVRLALLVAIACATGLAAVAVASGSDRGGSHGDGYARAALRNEDGQRVGKVGLVQRGDRVLAASVPAASAGASTASTSTRPAVVSRRSIRRRPSGSG